jgi:hypothetical protein
VDSLADVVSKVFRHVFAAANISIISIGQITAQQRKSETMASKLIAGDPQLSLTPFNPQCSEQLRTGDAG